MDMVDEAIYFFRANVLFSSFEFKGPADRAHVYLTVFVQQCLVKACADPTKTRAEIESILAILGAANPPVPGEAGFLLPGAYFAAPPATERERLRQYLKQLRQTTIARFTPIIFAADGKVSKWWRQFSKKKFMGISTA
jgi:actin related protein 2/3 complex subunit 3